MNASRNSRGQRREERSAGPLRFVLRDGSRATLTPHAGYTRTTACFPSTELTTLKQVSSGTFSFDGDHFDLTNLKVKLIKQRPAYVLAHYRSTQTRRTQDATVLPDAAREVLSGILYDFSVPNKPPVDLVALSDRFGQDNVVYRMLRQNAVGKAALATLYCAYVFEMKRDPWWNTYLETSDLAPLKVDQGSKPLYRLFLESGSTLLYLANQLRQQSPWRPGTSIYDSVARESTTHRLSTCTNNNLAALLLLNAQKHKVVPYLFPGYLEPKYQGLFTFYPRPDDPDQRVVELKAEEERVGYAQTRMYLTQCDLLLLAASRLSLTHGPIVGSRENAIFKNACYNACVTSLDSSFKKEVHLFITADKLVAESSRTGLHSLREEVDKIKRRECFPVFNIDVESLLLKSPFYDLGLDHDAPQQDGTRAVHLGGKRFRICDTWSDLFSKAGISVSVFVSYEASQLKSLQYVVNSAKAHFEPLGVIVDWLESAAKQKDRFLGIIGIDGGRSAK